MTLNREEKALVIGLTGGIGTGKSTASEYLTSLGMIHIDADAISRQLTVKVPGEENPVLEEIGKAFSDPEGCGVLREDGSLDRRAMADLVFSDPARKKTLEDILFRRIIQQIRRRIDEAKAGQVLLLDVPLLFESGLDSLCDRVIVVTAEEKTRLQRVVKRDGCTEEEVLARIRNQMPDEEKTSRADYIVDNSGTKDHLLKQLDLVWSDIKERN